MHCIHRHSGIRLLIITIITIIKGTLALLYHIISYHIISCHSIYYVILYGIILYYIIIYIYIYICIYIYIYICAILYIYIYIYQSLHRTTGQVVAVASPCWGAQSYSPPLAGAPWRELPPLPITDHIIVH